MRASSLCLFVASVAACFALGSASAALVQPRAEAAAAAARRPWPARMRAGITPNFILTDRVTSADWPREPRTPTTVDPVRFVAALRELCGQMPRERLERYGHAILEAAAAYHVDAFLIAALVYRESHCRADALNVRGTATGITQISYPMVAGDIASAGLRFRVADAEHPNVLVWQTIAMPARIGEGRITAAEPAIQLTAALLAMFERQHETLDRYFGGVPHRSAVSHFYWGDVVRSDWEEEQLLIDRRRALQYYGPPVAPQTVPVRGVQLSCALDGCPRVILSWLGAVRDDGAREHRGIDLDALPDEPVRAVADGVVVFAGVDLPGHAAHVQLRTQVEYETYARASLGAGGRYVCIRHDSDASRNRSDTLKSCYMHLEAVSVRQGELVTRGQLLGTVGRTGMQRSAAHLHIELHADQVLDPSVEMNGLILGRRPPAQRNADAIQAARTRRSAASVHDAARSPK